MTKRVSSSILIKILNKIDVLIKYMESHGGLLKLRRTIRIRVVLVKTKVFVCSHSIEIVQILGPYSSSDSFRYLYSDSLTTEKRSKT